LIAGQSPKEALSYLTDCINQAATIGIMNESPAVVAARESFKSAEVQSFHILGEATRSVT
jgi:hypothetical protein